MQYYTNLKKCKLCGSSDLTEVLHLKNQFLSPTFVKSNKDNKLSNVKVPMTLVICDKEKNPINCGLLQLKEMVKPDLLYTNYFYRSATSGIMRRDLKDVVVDIESRIHLDKNDIVVDIGANDCTTLSYFPPTLKKIAVEPAKNIDWSGLHPSIHVVNDYFSKNAVDQILLGHKAKVVIATAMFYDFDDPNTIVSEIKSILSQDGLLCIQLSYLSLMITNMNFYDICNEHLSYYSLRTMSELMKRHNLKIIDASINNVNGGSLRVFITHADSNAHTVNSQNLEALYSEEDKLNLYSKKTYEKFYQKMVQLGVVIKSFILDAKKDGDHVIGLGASTKGNVLLQFFGIDKTILPAISERNPHKVGLRTMGTDIKLISEKDARNLNPKYMLVLPWYFKNEIVNREKEYISQGGGLIFPMPYAHVVMKNGEKLLDA